jgi:hypothetical protein
MFSKILVKLIDQAILPAVLLLTTRIISVILISQRFGINFTLDVTGFAFANSDDYIVVNSYSTFAMITVLTVGLFYILIKSYLFHESHVKPHVTAKLFSLRLSSFIQSTFDLYSQGAIWLSYSYLVMIVSGVMTVFGLMYSWVFYVSFALCIMSTILLILDVENEIATSKSGYEYDTDEEFLTEDSKKYEH